MEVHILSSVRAGYEELGVDEYYRIHSKDYSNPHYREIEYLLKEYIKSHDIGENILDLCCGSGEVTKILNIIGKYRIEGLDPYTAYSYVKNTNNDCYIYNFKDIVKGALENKKYDTIICSFAMHLCEESMLNGLLYQLSRISNKLVILTPHKRPEINSWWREIYREKILSKARKGEKITIEALPVNDGGCFFILIQHNRNYVVRHFNNDI